MSGILIILDTPEAIAAAKARRLANLGHPYIPAAVHAANPWPPKRRRRESSPATPPAPASTCQPTTPEQIAAPPPASQAPATQPLDLFEGQT